VILGTKTNVAWLRRVVTHPAFRDARVSTRFLEEHDLTRTLPDYIPEIATAIASRARRAEGRVVGGAPTVPSVWDALGGWAR
jgi:acetyl/propionyl-CoA carboxylase alpha subunit